MLTRCWLCLWCVLAVPARAEEDVVGAGLDDATEVAKREFAAGSAAYKIGHFDEALAAYERAYQAKPLPGLLFNIGQCHFNVGNYERAAFFYESYLRERPTASNRALVEDMLREAQAQLERQRSDEQAALAAQSAVEGQRLEEERQKSAQLERARLEEQQRLAETERRTEEERRRAAEAASELEPWILWGSISGAAVVAVAGVVLIAALASAPPEIVPPSGTLGTIDSR